MVYYFTYCIFWCCAKFLKNTMIFSNSFSLFIGIVNTSYDITKNLLAQNRQMTVLLYQSITVQKILSHKKYWKEYYLKDLAYVPSKMEKHPSYQTTYTQKCYFESWYQVQEMYHLYLNVCRIDLQSVLLKCKSIILLINLVPFDFIAVTGL